MKVRLKTAVAGMALMLGLAPVFARAADVRAEIKVSHEAQHGDSSEVVVWLTPVSDSAGQPAASVRRDPPQLLEIIQHHKRFSPHLLVVQVGAVVTFPNKDPFFHNVFSLYDGKRFDLGLYEAGASRRVLFDREGICYIFCNIHPQMSAVVLVLDTPYYAISGADGGIEIPDVPPGEYQMYAWNERASSQSLKKAARRVNIADGSASLGTIRLQETSSPLLAHKNKYGRNYDPQVPSGPLYEPQGP